MGKLDSQLGLAETTESRDCRDLADGGDPIPLQDLSEVSQIRLAAHKQRIPTEGKAGAIGERCGVRDHLQRQGRELLFGRGERVMVHRAERRLCVYCDVVGVELHADQLLALVNGGHGCKPFPSIAAVAGRCYKNCRTNSAAFVRAVTNPPAAATPSTKVLAPLRWSRSIRLSGVGFFASWTALVSR